MTQWQIQASGKAVLSGEYAVLWGGAAIALPVGQARARRLISDDRSAFRVSLKPFGLVVRGSRSSAVAELDGAQGVADGFARMWNAALELWGKPAGMAECDYEIDSSELYRPDGTKWGWGSSGAAKALLVHLWFEGRLDVTTAHLRVRALEQALGAGGSGIDSAVSLAGSVLHYTMQGFRAAQARGVQGYWIALPESVKTETRVSAVLQAVAPAERRGLLDSARHTATAYHLGSYSQWLQALSHYDRLLDGVLLPLGLARVDKHVNAIQQTLGSDWYVRPSGAGGDGVLAIPAHSAAPMPMLDLPTAPVTL